MDDPECEVWIPSGYVALQNVCKVITVVLFFDVWSFRYWVFQEEFSEVFYVYQFEFSVCDVEIGNFDLWFSCFRFVK